MPSYCVSCGQVNTNWGNLCPPCKEEKQRAERQEELKLFEERGNGLVFYPVGYDPVVLYDTKDGRYHCCTHTLPASGKPWPNSVICDTCKRLIIGMANYEKERREEEAKILARQIKKEQFLRSFESKNE